MTEKSDSDASLQWYKSAIDLINSVDDKEKNRDAFITLAYANFALNSRLSQAQIEEMGYKYLVDATSTAQRARDLDPADLKIRDLLVKIFLDRADILRKRGNEAGEKQELENARNIIQLDSIKLGSAGAFHSKVETENAYRLLGLEVQSLSRTKEYRSNLGVMQQLFERQSKLVEMAMKLQSEHSGSQADYEKTIYSGMRRLSDYSLVIAGLNENAEQRKSWLERYERLTKDLFAVCMQDFNSSSAHKKRECYRFMTEIPAASSDVRNYIDDSDEAGEEKEQARINILEQTKYYLMSFRQMYRCCTGIDSRLGLVLSELGRLYEVKDREKSVNYIVQSARFYSQGGIRLLTKWRDAGLWSPSKTQRVDDIDVNEILARNNEWRTLVIETQVRRIQAPGGPPAESEEIKTLVVDPRTDHDDPVGLVETELKFQGYELVATELSKLHGEMQDARSEGVSFVEKLAFDRGASYSSQTIERRLARDFSRQDVESAATFVLKQWPQTKGRESVADALRTLALQPGTHETIRKLGAELDNRKEFWWRMP